MSNSKLTEKSSPILHIFLVSKLSENELMSTIYGQLPLNLWDDYSVSQNLLFWKRYKSGWHLAVITRYNVSEKHILRESILRESVLRQIVIFLANYLYFRQLVFGILHLSLKNKRSWKTRILKQLLKNIL